MMELEKLTDDELKILRIEVLEEWERRFNNVKEEEDGFDYIHR